MKFKKGNWEINSSSLINIEWRKGIPRLILHEKYEKLAKWTLRTFTFIGIVTSVISLEWYQSLILTIILFIVEQFIEKAVLEYTTIIVQKLPDFPIDGNRWKTMGFAMTEQKTDTAPPYMGPAFDDENYAIEVFNYIKSWNEITDEDPDNLVIVSFIIEPNSTYTFFIYANPARKNLSEQFKIIEEQRKYEKYGKRHQQLIMQFAFVHNFDYNPNLWVYRFLNTYTKTDTFLFTPFVVSPNTQQLKILSSLSFKKHQYKLKKREELTPNEYEYHTKIN